MTPLAFGMDIGGTSLKLGAWRDGVRLGWQDNLPVPETADEELIAGQIAGHLQVFATAYGSPAAIGIGSCGLIRGGVILESPNTPWDHLALVDLLRDRHGLDVLLVNDADAFLAGALNWLGLTAPSAIGVTLGTGVGTAFLLDGRIMAGGAGISPEAGHICINFEGGVASSGLPGTFEYYCGIAGLQRSYGAPGAEVTPKEIAERAGGGEGLAINAWSEYGTLCGVGLASLVNIFMPEVIVIGGGLAGSAPLFSAALAGSLARHKLRSVPLPRIEYVADQPDLVAYGAAVLALEAAP